MHNAMIQETGTSHLAPLSLASREIVPGKNLEHYLHTVKKIQQLSATEEHELAKKYYYQQDVEAARQLILSSLRYVVPVARTFSGYGLPLGDIIQEGNIGLMKAVKRFNPEENVRLMTFAIHWIRAEINEYVIKNWRIVKTATTKAQRKLFFKLRSSKKSLECFSDKDADQVAADLGVTRKDVLEMESRLYGKDIPTDVSDEDGEMATYPILISQESDPETMLIQEDSAAFEQKQMQHALSTLDERSRDILQKRWLTEDKVGLKALSAQYGVSMERIRQIEQQAIHKLKNQFVA